MTERETVLKTIKENPGQRPAVIVKLSGVDMNNLKYLLQRCEKDGEAFYDKTDKGKHWYIKGVKTIVQRVEELLRAAEKPLHYKQVAELLHITNQQGSMGLFNLKAKKIAVVVDTTELTNKGIPMYKHMSNMPSINPLESSAKSLNMPVEKYEDLADKGLSASLTGYMGKWCRTFYGVNTH